MKNINIIEKELPEECQECIEVLDEFNEVRFTIYGNSLSYCSPRPAPYYKNVVKNFEEKTVNLRKKCNVTIPNKWHYVIEHVPEYVDKKNISLGRTSDQLIESVHQHTNKFSADLHILSKTSVPLLTKME